MADYVFRRAVAIAETRPRLKIALCSFAGEYRMPPTWEEFAWSSKLGKGRERIWFSPSCREQQPESLQLRDNAVENYNRMSWIKPNFLWMMYRSNWGRSQGQEVVLAVRLKRSFFDSL